MKKSLFYLFLCFSLLFTTCGDDDTKTVDPTLQIDKQSVAFTNAAGSQTIAVTTNVDEIRVVSGQEWCKVASVKGNSGFTVTVAAEANPSSQARSTLIKVVASTVSEEINITQSSSPPHISPETSTVQISSDAQTKTITVDTNVADWSADVDEANKGWCSATPRNTADGSFLDIKVELNTNMEPRSAVITLSAAGQTVPLTVEQDGTNDPILIADKTEIKDVPAAGDSYTVNVTSNVDYTVTPSERWIIPTKSTDGKTVTIEVEPSDVESVRTGTVMLEGDGVSVTINVNQLKFVPEYDPVLINLTAANFTDFGYLPANNPNRGPIALMFDGLFNTFHQNKYTENPVGTSQNSCLQINLAEEINVFRFWYYNRIENISNRIRIMDVLVSADGANWTLLKTLTKDADNLPMGPDPAIADNQAAADPNCATCQYTTEWFSSDVAFKHIKILVKEAGSASSGTSPAFCISEFKLYKGNRK